MKTWIAANWKLNKSPRETKAYFDQWFLLAPALGLGPDLGVAFFPPATSLDLLSQIQQREGLYFSFGPQNCYSEVSGAFTGEVSAAVAKDLGADFVLLGHSERRSLFHEKDDLLAQKLRLVQSLGLKPMFCIGESLQERQRGETGEILRRQLREGLQHAVQGSALVVAYEPVWAIGTGQVASLEQVAEAHALIREELISLGQNEVPILYGGSVKAENAGPLARIPHVNGFLVGGASLEPDSFAKIVKAAKV